MPKEVLYLKLEQNAELSGESAVSYTHLLGKGDFCHLCDEFCVGVCLGEQREQDILLIQTG